MAHFLIKHPLLLMKDTPSNEMVSLQKFFNMVLDLLQLEILMGMGGMIFIQKISHLRQPLFYLITKEIPLLKRKVVKKVIFLNMQDMALIIELVIQQILIQMVIQISLLFQEYMNQSKTLLIQGLTQVNTLIMLMALY